jgi:acyl-CoA thioesterase
MTGFASLVAAARQSDGSLRCELPDDWRQGRTAYGGLTAAFAYQAARDTHAQLPPLRSAQIAFIGPVGATMHARATMLRRGRSSAFVEVRLDSDGELAMIGTFLFMADRASPVSLAAADAPAAPQPEDAEPAMRGKGPAYRSQLEFRHAATMEDRRKPELLRWARLREREGLDLAAELLLIGDALPAAILPMLDTPPMVSSANWTVHLPVGELDRHDGWWLVRSKALSAVGGISCQDMAVWNRDRKAALWGSQAVSFFTSNV